jgi:hypothetical protein
MNPKYRAYAAAIGAWALARAKEPSTWTGLAAVAIALGWPDLAARLTHLGSAIPLLLGGTALAAATTSSN